MTKEKIRFLIGLMLVAVVSFIAFQWYVIKEAVMVKNDQFNLRVAEAVQSVVHRLEKDEIIFLLQHRIDMELQRNKLQRMTVVDRKKVPSDVANNSISFKAQRQKPDSVLASLRGPVERIPKRLLSDADVLQYPYSVHAMTEYQMQIMEDFFQIQQRGIEDVSSFIQGQIQGDKASEITFLFPDLFFDADLFNSFRPDGSNNVAKREVLSGESSTILFPNKESIITRPAHAEVASSKEELLRDVIREIVYAKRPIHERVNRFLLDSMLKKELQESGIDLAFEFAVKKSTDHETLFTTAQLPSENWDEYAYKTTLFPNQLSNEVSQLYVYFPGKEQFVFGTIISLLVGSGTMVLAVLAIFYIAISTIVKQKKLSEMKNDFINNMTHEFKTPISTIALAVDMAKDTPNANRYLNIIKEENHRLGDHVEKVLQTALLDKGELKLTITAVNMHDIIVRVLNSFAVTLEQKEGEVDLEFEASNEIVNGDETHLYGVIRNLIDNAIKYSSDKTTINIETSNVDKGIQVVIKDQGLGMTKEQQDKVFDKFYRVSTGNRHDVKGFGLGLSYAKEMVQLHHGTIRVTSKPSEGSIFVVWLPQETIV